MSNRVIPQWARIALYDIRGIGSKDFHALNSEQVEKIISLADSRGYRAPKNAKGSRARYFYAYLERVAAR